MGPPKGVWITPWITEMNWNWMEKDFASLRNARDLVVGRLADLVPGPDHVAALDPEAGPGHVAAPGLAAVPGPRTGPSLAIEASHVTGPSLAIDPGPDHVTVQTPNRSLDRDLALNPEMIKKHHINENVKTKQEIIAGARR